MKHPISLTIALLTHVLLSSGQTILPLYQGASPNSRPAPDQEYSETNAEGILIVHKISRPTLTVFLPEHKDPRRTAVIICPGGAYAISAAGHEGFDVAREFNKQGITAFVLKYRIPDDATMQDRSIGPLQDAQRALQLVRESASQWDIDPAQIGMLGFSAGGHLAASAGSHFSETFIDNPRNTSLRPDFLVLIYPVISFTDSIGHIGSRENLLGKTPSPERIRYFSNELQVNKNTPPTFLVHAKDDWVDVKNSLVFSEALNNAGVKSKLIVFEEGGHGYGMVNPKSEIRWMDELGRWIGTLK